jgi:hypothetical protein
MDALRPSEFVNLVANEFCCFVREKLLPLAASTGTKFYIAGVLPPVVEDRCELLPLRGREREMKHS